MRHSISLSILSFSYASTPWRLLSSSILLAGVPLSIGCDKSGNSIFDGERYELKQDKIGRTIRLDRRTGKIAVLDGDTLVDLDAPLDEKFLSEAAEPKT